MSPHILELEGVARRFGQRWALRGVHLRVPAGEVLALAGANGSGKTTLLRICATLLAPSHGRLRLLGRDPAAEAEELRGEIGFLAHSTGLYLDLTGAENLRFAARMTSGAGSIDIGPRLAEFGLAQAADRPARTYSAGMRRRLALARVLLGEPSLLLLDEPYASFDEEGIGLLELAVRAVRERGGAVLLATHDLERARRIADRVVGLEAGRLVAPPDAPRPGRVAEALPGGVA